MKTLQWDLFACNIVLLLIEIAKKMCEIFVTNNSCLLTKNPVFVITESKQLLVRIMERA